METKKKVIFISIILVTVCTIGIVIYSIFKYDYVDYSNAVKFRNEYMELNDKICEETGKEYSTVLISENNTVKYANSDEIINMLESGTGIIYFGYSSNQRCRTLVPILVKVAEELETPIYYLDIYDMKSSFELIDGTINKIKQGTEDYYKILELLDDELEELFLTDTEGNRFSTGEKKLIVPSVIAVKNGDVTGIYDGLLLSQAYDYSKLSDVEIEKITKDLTNLINSNKQDNICTFDKC